MFLRVHHLTGFRSFSYKHGHISMGALEGLPNTNPREISNSKARPKNHVIFTLNPKKFAEKRQQRIHITPGQPFGPCVLLHKQSHPVHVLAPRLDYDHCVDESCRKDSRLRPPYPPITKGYLYYFTPPENPSTPGELRLRITTSNELASFESGLDLIRKNGQTWSLSLYALSQYNIPLYEKLREDRLIPKDLDKAISTLRSKNPNSQRNHLHTLNDTFTLDFSKHESTFLVTTEHGMESLLLQDTFFDFREICNSAPYKGRALAQFERSTLREHKGTRTVVLRFLKIVTPVKFVIPNYDGYICCPKEGELYRRARDQSVWSVNIDESEGAMIRGLQLLWDT